VVWADDGILPVLQTTRRIETIDRCMPLSWPIESCPPWNTPVI